MINTNSRRRVRTIFRSGRHDHDQCPYERAHGDALAVKANAVLENYKSHGGRTLRTNSVSRTPDRPAEQFVAAIFGRANFLEAAFARFKLVDGVGCSIVYSHRIYGEKVGDQMSKWLNDNGPKMEKALMDGTTLHRQVHSVSCRPRQMAAINSPGRIFRLTGSASNRSSCRNCTPCRYSWGNFCRSSCTRAGPPPAQPRKSRSRQWNRQFLCISSYKLKSFSALKVARVKM